MKKFTFKGVLDGFRQTVQQQAKVEAEIPETLRAEHFQLRKVSFTILLVPKFIKCAFEDQSLGISKVYLMKSILYLEADDYVA